MDLDENTRLLPKVDESQSIFQKNELHLFGVVPDNLREVDIDLSGVNKTRVRKIACGNSHCLILFSDGELFGFGENICGQIGLSIAIKDSNYISEIKRVKFAVPDIKDYKIIDIACGDQYSLVLINSKGVNYLIRFGIGKEDLYKNDYENLNTVVKL
jgi:alpha-tubulin suppressor-like RCC1 family protein